MKKSKLNLIKLLLLYIVLVIQISFSQPGIQTLTLYPTSSGPQCHSCCWYRCNNGYNIGRKDNFFTNSGITVFRSTFVYDIWHNIPQDATIYSVKLIIMINSYGMANGTAKVVALPLNTETCDTNNYNRMPSGNVCSAGIAYNANQDQTIENTGILKDSVQLALDYNGSLVLGVMSEQESTDNSYANLSMRLEIKYFLPRYRITVKNSFGGGEFWIGDNHYVNTNQNGYYRDLNYGQVYSLTAVDNQIFQNLNQRFKNWTKENVNGEKENKNGNPLEITIDQDLTFTANFVREYNITISNNYPSLGNVGKMKFAGTEYDMPHNAFPVTEDNEDKAFEAITNVYNYIQYTFDHWSDNYPYASRIIKPTNHESHTAYYTGKPLPVTITGYQGNNNDPINITWEEHPNTNVTQYQVWRAYRHNGITYGPTQIATLNRGTTTFTDNDYQYAQAGLYLLSYDIRPYYSIEGTTAEPNWLHIWGDVVFWKGGKNEKDNGNNLSENIPSSFSIQNYPNPCNPSTTFNIELPVSGNVQLKIYNTLGSEITTLLDKYMNAGTHSIRFDGKNLPTGTYIYRMVSGTFVKTGKILLMK
jgi:hypothetical protein